MREPETVAPPTYDPAKLTVLDLGGGKADMNWPPDWKVEKVGRDGKDSSGSGPWEGVPSQLPFSRLAIGTSYNLYVKLNDGAVVTRVHVPK